MKIIAHFWVFFLICILPDRVLAQSLQVAVDPIIYQSEKGGILELNYQVIGNTISFDTSFITVEPRLNATLEALILFYQDSSIVKADRYRLRSPSLSKKGDFIDVRSYGLPSGKYSLVARFTDARDTVNTYTYHTDLNIKGPYTSDTISFSSIKLLALLEQQTDSSQSQWVRQGVIMEPLPHHFYDSRHKRLNYYTELYGLATSSIRPLVLHTELLSKKNEDWEKIFQSYDKLDKYEPIQRIANRITISTFPSDYYKLILRVIDAKKKEYATVSTYFYYSNPESDQKIVDDLLADGKENYFMSLEEDKLNYSLRAIAPIASQTDQPRINYIIANGAKDMKADFLLNYWVGRSAGNYVEDYTQFMKLADALNEKYYNAFGYGFETDRGVIYLKYGAPTRIANRQNDQGAVPYEIWTYDQIDYTSQTNVKFVFYNPTLAGNDYILLHSNCRNEISTPNWLQYIYSSQDQIEGDNRLDATGVQDNFGREAARLFNDN